jgi:arsenite transporter
VTADQLLTALFNAGVAISVGATVLSLGMTFTVGKLVAPLHRVVLVIGLVVLNAVVIPAAAWGIAEVSPMGGKYMPGLVLATLGAGSAASLKAAQLAKRADLPLAVSVVVVLQLINIVAVPLWAGQLVTGASISVWDIVKSLLLLVLLPLVAGLFIRARYADRAKDWQPGLVKAVPGWPDRGAGMRRQWRAAGRTGTGACDDDGAAQRREPGHRRSPQP